MPRKAHTPTDATRAEVRALTSFGVTADEVCKYIGVSRMTLFKHYKRELETAHISANATVAKFLYSMASGRAINDGATYADCSRSAIFWMKTRGRWSEKDELDLTTNGESINRPASELTDDEIAAIIRKG